MEDQTPKSSRRVRYKGTHPKSFKEKYKELNPENFSEDVEKVMQQGRTPAGMHRSICVNEILEFLNIQPGQIGMDATLGYGGHSLEMLKCLVPNGHLYATDVDPFELPKTRDRLTALVYGPEILTIKKMNFSNIDLIAYESGPLNFVLADFGDFADFIFYKVDFSFYFFYLGARQSRVFRNLVPCSAVSF